MLRIRKLTPRECLRVQGYPESFEFPEGVTQNQMYKQLGNTVAIPVLENILKEHMIKINIQICILIKLLH